MSEANMEMYAGIIGALFLLGMLVGSVVALLVTLIKMFYAKNNGASYWGLMWLPFGAQYVLGQLADKYEDKKARIKYPIVYGIFCFFTFAYLVIVNVINAVDPEITSPVSKWTGFYSVWLFMGALLLYVVYNVIVFYKIFAYKTEEGATGWSVFNFFISLAAPLFMLINMKKEGKSKEEAELSAKE